MATMAAFTTCGTSSSHDGETSRPESTGHTGQESKAGQGNKTRAAFVASICGISSIQVLPVKTAIRTTTQKMSAPTPRVRMRLPAAGRRAPSARPGSLCDDQTQRSHTKIFHPAARSARQVQTARIMLRNPTNWAIIRWMCSNFTPPTVRDLVERTERVGQSGTDRQHRCW